ncbi:hypothetical protein QJS04_geneDACA002988 [Acorus gramineus]|uniref:Uncharacterized protein n=1 Tax=Acorus gramineus TaxID=55184 RepID=A0AAV9BW65_ACOGR|nr:hypothetical protein QJS04_geneDACA002988 [Acorus gramineus]
MVTRKSISMRFHDSRWIRLEFLHHRLALYDPNLNTIFRRRAEPVPTVWQRRTPFGVRKFYSVACNSHDFQNTTLNSDLRYRVWDNPPQMEPHFLNVSDYDETVHTGTPFARQFHMDDPVLDKIDREILRRGYNQVVPGGWCTGDGRPWFDPCSKWGDPNLVKPGP